MCYIYHIALFPMCLQTDGMMAIVKPSILAGATIGPLISKFSVKSHPFPDTVKHIVSWVRHVLLYGCRFIWRVKHPRQAGIRKPIKDKSVTDTVHCIFTMPRSRLLQLLSACCFYELCNLAAYVRMARVCSCLYCCSAALCRVAMEMCHNTTANSFELCLVIPCRLIVGADYVQA